MKRNHLYITIIALLTLFVATSCSKSNEEEAPTPPPAPAKLITNKPLIKAIEASASVSFTKDANGDVDVAVNQAKIKSITVLNIVDVKLASSAGIEYFTELTTLEFHNNELKTIDITQLTKLTDFACNNNLLTALDVTKNTALTSLACKDNQLAALDVTKNVALIGLHCVNNQLTVLDVTKNLLLATFACEENNLTALDVSANTDLFYLTCYDNRLTTLDITHNRYISCKLTSFICGAQTSNGTTAQDLTLKVTESQESTVTVDWTMDKDNKGVKIIR